MHTFDSSDLHRLSTGQFEAGLQQREYSEHDALSQHHDTVRRDIAQQVEVCMHQNGSCDPLNPETAAALRFLHEHAEGDTDHLHRAYMQSILAAQQIGDECRKGDYSRFPLLQSFLAYAVPHASAHVTREECAEWEGQHLAYARSLVQEKIDAWRESFNAQSEELLELLEEHDLVVGMDVNLSSDELRFLHSVRRSVVQTKDHSTTA